MKRGLTFLRVLRHRKARPSQGTGLAFPMTRRGYTFIEILLVLAILAVIAGMAWPAVIRFSGEQSIKDAAERVRSELDRTRFRAIDAGLAYQFRYEPGGRRYLAVPFERDLMLPQNADPLQPVATHPVLSGQIAEGLTFQPTPGGLPAGEMLATEWLAGLADAAELSQARWSSPILYRPDGTGMTTTFRIADDEQRFIEVSVRELTGMATAGPVRTEVGL